MHVKPVQVFRPIGVLNTFIELRHSKAKYEFVFYKVSSSPSPSSLLKLPPFPNDGGNENHHQLKRLMRETIAVHVRYKFLDISLK